MISKLSDCGIRFLLASPSRRVPAEAFGLSAAARVRKFHRSLPGYTPTPLVELKALARQWGLGEVWVKDEAPRFGLKAFKVLGASYAVARLLGEQLGLDEARIDFVRMAQQRAGHGNQSMTLATATDGNHGRGVAWVAQQLGMRAVVYMPKGTVPARVAAIRQHGAQVRVTDVNYDDTVRLVWEQARKQGWTVVQDTAWEGYAEIPRWIMQGYTTMAAEAVDQMANPAMPPTHVFVQAGVGAFAAAMVGYLSQAFAAQPPKFVVMEPTRAACMLASAKAADGQPHSVGGALETIMAGLACGEPSLPAWQILNEWSSAYLACEDALAADGMRILAAPFAGDQPVEAGESGAVGIGLLHCLCNHPQAADLRQALQLDADARVLLFNTEGATDPESYERIVAGQDSDVGRQMSDVRRRRQ